MKKMLIAFIIFISILCNQSISAGGEVRKALGETESTISSLKKPGAEEEATAKKPELKESEKPAAKSTEAETKAEDFLTRLEKNVSGHLSVIYKGSGELKDRLNTLRTQLDKDFGKVSGDERKILDGIKKVIDDRKKMIDENANMKKIQLQLSEIEVRKMLADAFEQKGNKEAAEKLRSPLNPVLEKRLQAEEKDAINNVSKAGQKLKTDAGEIQKAETKAEKGKGGRWAKFKDKHPDAAKWVKRGAIIGGIAGGATVLIAIIAAASSGGGGGKGKAKAVTPAASPAATPSAAGTLSVAAAGTPTAGATPAATGGLAGLSTADLQALLSTTAPAPVTSANAAATLGLAPATPATTTKSSTATSPAASPAATPAATPVSTTTP